jgi:putative SOS response-associated peptidase YedK
MCGRVDIHSPPSELSRLLETALAAGVDPDGRPSWNVGPTRALPAVVQRDDQAPVLDMFRWGLVPHWAKNPRVGYKMINARAETVATKPAYRQALRRHRCLIVVDGFFEWAVPDADKPKQKQPYYFSRSDGQPITFAGLYESWWDKSRSEMPDPETFLQTCVIVTTEAGLDMEEVHNRMPVIIEAENRGRWLDHAEEESDVVAELLVPSPGGTLVRHPISRNVNNVRNDGPQIISPHQGVDPANVQS